jgi:probable addiction module antidote protein
MSVRIARGATRRRLYRKLAPQRRKGRDFAVEYLNALLEDADREELTATLARIAQRSGGRRLAEKVELNADMLYRALCRRGNPELRSAAALLRAMGIRLRLQAIPGFRVAQGH